MKTFLPLLFSAFLVFHSGFVNAGSATWNANPISNDWDDAANWTPQTVPQEMTDVATFDVSTVTNPVFSNWTEVFLAELVFNPGASSYMIGGSRLALFGPGLVNNSGIAQTVQTDFGFEFWGASRAGDNVTYNVHPDPYYDSYFFDESSAGTATFLVDGLVGTGYEPGRISFSSNTSAADSTIVLATGDVYGGSVAFDSYSSAANSIITAAPHASIGFADYATAATATITADSATVFFDDSSSGGIATLTLTNSSTLELRNHDATAAMTVGALTTDNTSLINLGSANLTFIGPDFFGPYISNIADVISGHGGIVVSDATAVTLRAVNTYTGGTTVTGGKLTLLAGGGSAVGSGPVTVVDGTLAGRGLIIGAVTIGGGQLGQVGNLFPTIAQPLSLKMKGPLTFTNGSRYQWRFNATNLTAATVAARGITIEGSANFSFASGGELPVGTVFTALSNTATTPTSGFFVGLPEGATVVSGVNTFQVSYKGGDGNDVTLTVVP